jgi:hypothetical protein
MHQIIFRPLGMKNTYVLTTIGIKILLLPLKRKQSRNWQRLLDAIYGDKKYSTPRFIEI